MKPRALDLLLLLAVFAVGLLLRGWTAATYGIDVAIGPDAPLWGLVGLYAADGGTAILPPVFPRLMVMLAGDPAGVADAGMWLNRVVGAALGPLVALAVWRWGGGRRAAVGAGLLCAVQADLLAVSLQLQPEALTALAGVGLLLLLRHHLERRSWGSAALLTLVGALAAQTREHGLVWLVALGPLLVVRPPRGAGAPLWRALGAVVLLAGIAVGVGVATGAAAPATPLRWDWTERFTIIAADAERAQQGQAPLFLDSTLEDYPPQNIAALQEADRAYSRAVQAPGGVGPGERLRRHALRLFGVGLDLWPLLGLAVLGVGLQARRERRWEVVALLLPLVALLPMVHAWSQRRHVVVLVPVMAVGVGLLSARLPGRARWLALLLPVVGWLWFLPQLNRALAFQHEAAERARPAADLGRALAEMAPDGAILPTYGMNDLRRETGRTQLYAGLPVGGPREPGGEVGPAAWRGLVLWAGGALPAGWTPIGSTGSLQVLRYRVDVTGEARRCSEAVLVLPRPWFVGLPGGPQVRFEAAAGCESGSESGSVHAR